MAAQNDSKGPCAKFVSEKGAVPDTSICSSAVKICPKVKAWLQCSHHVLRNFTAKLRSIVSHTTSWAELCKCLKTLSSVWSLVVFMADWAALGAQYCTSPAFLDYAQKEYTDKRTYRFSGASPLGIPLPHRPSHIGICSSLKPSIACPHAQNSLSPVDPSTMASWKKTLQKLRGRPCPQCARSAPALKSLYVGKYSDPTFGPFHKFVGP